MDDDEMYEEHLDEEDNSSETTTKSELELAKNHAQNQHLTRRKLLILIALHVQNFQRAIITSRRRSMRRMRRRQSSLRAFFMQQMLEVETSFMELLLPLPHNLNVKQEEPEKIDESIADGGFFEYVLKQFDKQQWMEKFRMSKKTYRWLCMQLKGMPIHGISLEKSIAIALYAFSTMEDYRTIATIFSVSRSQTWTCTRNFAETLIEKLGKCLIVMPKNEQEYGEIRVGCQQASNMPALAVGVLGVLDLFVKPLGQKTVRLILQTLIDDRLLFRKVEVAISEPTLFLKSPNEITMLEKQQINERLLPSFVITPANYSPLRPWLLQRYDEPAAPHEYDFNEAVDNLLLLRQQAFDRLFGRWKILQRKIDMDVRYVELIVIACCALHNLLEETSEGFIEKWSENSAQHMLFTSTSIGTKDSAEALEMRDFLARTISSTEI